MSNPSIELATRDAEEFHFLSKITDDLTAEKPKLLYADWLESRADPRGEFLREFVRVTRSLEPSSQLPDSSWLPRSWKNVVGVTLVEGLVQFGLTDAKDIILAVTKPMVSITAQRADDKKVPIGQSRFGGMPDLPENVKWPRCHPRLNPEIRKPLSFVGQIELNDIAGAQATWLFPKVGLLSFFVFQDWNVGFQPNNSEEMIRDTCVLYTPPSVSLVRHEAPTDLDPEANGIFPECTLAFHESLDIPDAWDDLPMKAYVDEFRGGSRWENLSYLRDSHGGYNHHFMGCSVHGRFCGDPSPGRDWVNLICLHSDKLLVWNWCDGQHLAFFVRKKDIPNCAFDDATSYAS